MAKSHRQRAALGPASDRGHGGHQRPSGGSDRVLHLHRGGPASSERVPAVARRRDEPGALRQLKPSLGRHPARGPQGWVASFNTGRVPPAITLGESARPPGRGTHG
jgi:hypothetical protein